MPLSSEQLSRLQALVRSGYLPTIEQLAKSLTAPIWWDHPGGVPFARGRGGTVCFVHTTQRILGITAAHVHTEVTRLRENDPTIWCQVGAHTFEPEQRLIDIDEELDLATYEFTQITANLVGASVHHPSTWPPQMGDGDLGLLGGWPWVLSVDRETATTHRFLHFVCRLQRSSNDQMGAATFTSTSVPWGAVSFRRDMNLGGMSGGPIYRLEESGLSALTLVGIIYEYQPTFEFVLGRPLRLIRADGTIARDLADA